MSINLQTSQASASTPRLQLNASLLWGGSMVALIVILAIGARWIAPFDPYYQNLSHRLAKPFWDAGSTGVHWLGTDGLGRDYLSLIIYGARTSILIALCVGMVAALIGITLGTIGGYFGGKTDEIVMFIITTRLSMPGVLITLAIVAIIGSSMLVVIIVMGCLSWDRFAVVSRSLTQKERQRDYVTAARIHGRKPPAIILLEILPNLLAPLLVILSIEMASAVLTEASLSFLGLGVQPPDTSWGLMISQAKDYIFFDPWLVFIPGLAIFTLVLGIYLLGDGINKTFKSGGY